MKKLSCGVLVLQNNKILMGRATGHDHWDIPKGCADAGELPLDAAVRETFEETGIKIPPSELQDRGKFAYNNEKDLYLYWWEPSFEIRAEACVCHSLFTNQDGQLVPELDLFAMYSFEEALAQAGPRLSQVLAKELSDYSYFQETRHLSMRRPK